MLAVLAALMLAVVPQQHDTVFTADGGRVVGTVIEEGPEAISIQLPDGTFRRVPRKDVTRIEYADGSVSTFGAGQPRAPAAEPGSATLPGAAVDLAGSAVPASAALPAALSAAALRASAASTGPHALARRADLLALPRLRSRRRVPLRRD